MSNNDNHKYTLPESDDSDLFSDAHSEPDSSDDEADLLRNRNHKRHANASPPPLSSRKRASKPLDENPQTLKKIRRECRLQTALEGIKDNKSLHEPNSKVTVPPLETQQPRLSSRLHQPSPRRKTSKYTPIKDTKTEKKRQATKQKRMPASKLSVVYDQHKVVEQDGEYEFVKVEGLLVNKGPSPPIPREMEMDNDDNDDDDDGHDEAALNTMEPYLTRLGWTHPWRKAQYKLVGEPGFAIKLPRARMLELVKELNVSVGAGGGDAPNEFTAGRIEENLLFTAVEKRIAEYAMMTESFVECEQEVQKKKVVTTKKRGGGAASSINIVATRGSTSAPADEHTNSASIRMTKKPPKFTRMTKKTPKFRRMTKAFPSLIRMKDRNFFCLTQQKVDEIAESVLNENKNADASRSDGRKLLAANICASYKDKDTMLLEVKGQPDLAEKAHRRILDSVRYEICKYNCQLLLDDVDCIEVDVKFDITRDLGFELKCFDQKNLWICDVGDDSQFREVFGRKANRGAVITHLAVWDDTKRGDNMQEVSGPYMLEEITQKANQKRKQWIAARICLSWHEHLANIDINRFLPRHGSAKMPSMRSKRASNVYRILGAHRERFLDYRPVRKPPQSITRPHDENPVNANIVSRTIRKKNCLIQERAEGASNENKTSCRNGRGITIETAKNVENIGFNSKVHPRSLQGAMTSPNDVFVVLGCPDPHLNERAKETVRKEVVKQRSAKRKMPERHLKRISLPASNLNIDSVHRTENPQTIECIEESKPSSTMALTSANKKQRTIPESYENPSRIHHVYSETRDDVTEAVPIRNVREEARARKVIWKEIETTFDAKKAIVKAGEKVKCAKFAVSTSAQQGTNAEQEAPKADNNIPPLDSSNIILGDMAQLSTACLIQKYKHCTFEERNAFTVPMKRQKRNLLDLKTEATMCPLAYNQKKKDMDEKIKCCKIKYKALKILELGHFIINGRSHNKGVAYFLKITKPGSTIASRQQLFVDLDKDLEVLSKDLEDICNWIRMFQTEDKKNEMGMDYDISNLGVSLLHAAILVGKENTVNMMINADKGSASVEATSSPLQFAEAMKHEAMKHEAMEHEAMKHEVLLYGACEWVEKYNNVIIALGHLL